MKKIIAAIIVVLIGAAYWWLGGAESKNGYVLEKLTKGDITERITASGIINPISTINIGTQVSGTIAEIYVDYNTPVKKNQLLAQIDPSLFEATVEQRRAALNVAKAQVDVVKNDIEFNKKHLDRIKKLHSSQYSADKELESAQRDYSNSLVNLQLQQAQVKQAEASLLSAETELKYTKIVSPVEGIVISKEVEVGQTVAASFQTPTLFMVAEDLTKMEIIASIVEADIAKVMVGQVVEFRVDSYPDTMFFGMVSQVRNSPITVQNVVSYDVVVEIDNKDRLLKPGMTANIEIITAEKTNVVLAPNQALRFFMTDEKGQTKRYKDRGIWVLERGQPKRISIRTGVADEEHTEVISDQLKEGVSVIVEKNGSAQTTSSPVRMRMPR